MNEVNEKTFAHQQDSVAKVLKAAGAWCALASLMAVVWLMRFGPVAGRKWFLRSDVVTTLTDDLIHQSVEKFAETPDGCAWLFELGGGAMVDFAEGTPIPKKMREGSFNIVAFHQWKVDDADEACVDSAEEVSLVVWWDGMWAEQCALGVVVDARTCEQVICWWSTSFRASSQILS